MKTISGHYDTVFSIEHNNRVFIPSNVDPTRVHLNYQCVAAGQLINAGCEPFEDLSVFWAEYRDLSSIYWEDRAITKKQAYEEYKKYLMSARKYQRTLKAITDTGISALITLLFLPLLIPCGIYMNCCMIQAKTKYQNMMDEQWLRDMEFKAAKLSFREAINEQDRVTGTQYLQVIDSVVKEMAQLANDHTAFAKDISTVRTAPVRFATLEEIYDRLFEPSFRAFQSKQRPCRRYNGTYLESIREGQRQESKKCQQSKNSKRRQTAEAIEIVFGIGDMDNTGYIKANTDAQKAEMLLKDFCDHLITDPYLCVVTTKELEDPNWEPPFKNGLIVLNLTVHCDEATPGVHLTCIPYSRGCKRGPAVQAAMGRALTGMGYPSTWADALDENGKQIPKRDREGKVVYNKDGTIRYQQVPDKQGILDWIEVQKVWLQREMAKRYGWLREYKGSHPRGNLSTPDYKVARAKERSETIKKETEKEFFKYMAYVRKLSSELQHCANDLIEEGTESDIVLYYLKYCPEENYERIVSEANAFWDKFALHEEQKMLKSLQDRVRDAETRSHDQNTKKNELNHLPGHNRSRQ